MSLDVEKIRQDFPILSQKVFDRPIVYFDNGATTQKPSVVIDTVRRYYEEKNASIHRGVHFLSDRSTAIYENARERVRAFINAESSNEVIFTSGTTGSINALAFSFGERYVSGGDEVLVTEMEHHSNIVPWQLLCESSGATLRVAPMDDTGTLLLDGYERLLGPKTKLVALVHVSNSLGTVNPVKQMVRLAKKWEIPVLLDGAQAAPHQPIDVQDLGCDFYALSGHKMYGPTGIGVLYGRLEVLEGMPPYQGGGEMIRSVTFERTTYAPPPAKFEAGTPDIAGAIGLGATVDYLAGIGWGSIQGHERRLLSHALDQLATVPGIRMIGSAASRASVVSFVMDGIHAHDLGTILDQAGVAIRTGHHCTQPVMDFFGVPATARASFAFYNTLEEVDVLVNALTEARRVFGLC